MRTRYDIDKLGRKLYREDRGQTENEELRKNVHVIKNRQVKNTQVGVHRVARVAGQLNDKKNSKMFYWNLGVENRNKRRMD